MTITEIQKEKILIRKENPDRALAFGNLIDGAKKLAKLENREADNNDIIIVAKKTIKILEKTLNEIGKGMLFDSYQAEIEVCKEFLPEMISEEVLEKKIIFLISDLENKSMKEMGNIINLIKQEFGESADMGFVSRTIKIHLSQ